VVTSSGQHSIPLNLKRAILDIGDFIILILIIVSSVYQRLPLNGIEIFWHQIVDTKTLLNLVLTKKGVSWAKHRKMKMIMRNMHSFLYKVSKFLYSFLYKVTKYLHFCSLDFYAQLKLCNPKFDKWIIRNCGRFVSEINSFKFTLKHMQPIIKYIITKNIHNVIIYQIQISHKV
jgi:hypothetical protein